MFPPQNDTQSKVQENTQRRGSESETYSAFCAFVRNWWHLPMCFFFFGRSFYLLSRKFTNKDIGHENTPEDFEHPVWLCEESSHIHMADFFLFPDKRERQAACVLITAVKHFKPQDHTQICIDLIPKNKAPLKSPWLPSEPVQQSSGRPRFESKSLARAWDNVCWLSEMTRPIFPRRPPPHDVEKPLVTAETGL